MDLSSNRSHDEDKVMERQLYREGQPQPRPSTPARKPSSGSSSRNAKTGGGGKRLLLMILMLGVGYYLVYGNADQRKKVFVGLSVAGWLLLLGGISYCLCLPNLEVMSRQRMAIIADPNLTSKQKFEKVREIESRLTSSQRRAMRAFDIKAMIRMGNAKMYEFLRLSPDEQVAQLRKEAAEREKRRKEWEKRRKEWEKARGNRPPRNQNSNNQGNNNANNNNNNRGGSPGGGGANRDVSALESGASPEARAGGAYKRGLWQQLGLNSGGKR